MTPSAPKKRKAARRNTNTLRVLFTCIGRRVELIMAFRRAGETLGLDIELHGTDVNWLSPGMHRVDRGHIVSRIDSGHYLEDLVRIARKFNIDLLIPLLDPELPLLADGVDQLAQVGCHAVVSSADVVRICNDKMLTYQTLKAAKIDTPKTWTWAEAIKVKRHKYPLFLKPRAGSAAVGNHVIHNFEELKTFGRLVDDAIVQEFVPGIEHTLDVYTGFDGIPRCAVPRKRIEVRTGEVSKGVIVKDRRIMAIGKQVAKVLGECRGVVTVQCMVTLRGRIRVIEINPRFGGGAPLAIHAGANFPKWLLQEHSGNKPRISDMGFRDDVAMLRYDESVFVNRASKIL